MDCSLLHIREAVAIVVCPTCIYAFVTLIESKIQKDHHTWSSSISNYCSLYVYKKCMISSQAFDFHSLLHVR